MSQRDGDLSRTRVALFHLLLTSSVTAAGVGFLSFSGSMRTRTTPDLSTTSWISLPFLPMTFPSAGETQKVMLLHIAIDYELNLFHLEVKFTHPLSSGVL